MTTPSPARTAPSSGAGAASQALAKRASACIAGGVVSLNRKVEPSIAFVRAQGSRLYDADGNEYIDYHGAFAPYLLGHNDPEINAAVVAAISADHSLMGSGTTPWEVELAEALRAAVPSLELVQITNTGSEATAHAIRLARAWTGRDDIILTLGGYNGAHNDVARTVSPALADIGPRVSPGEYPFLPLSAGIPREVMQRVHIVNFNDLPSVERLLATGRIACVLTEPVLQNIGVVPPLPGYLQGLRDACTRHGTVLAFDEVKTGFRSALGGYQSLAGLRPDLSVFGKAVANGYPLGVIGGRADIMGLFDAADPKRRVLVAGTYNAHPLASAAAIATLARLRRGDGEVYRHLETLGRELESGMSGIFSDAGITSSISRIGSAFCVYFCDHVPVDWHDVATNHDQDLDRRLRRALIDRGIYLFPLPCKQGSISYAHTSEDIARTLETTRAAIKAL
ncbi:MAG: aspartate aminotransferase family protein [Planctomycetes bacterium]|nr:aspartate aminotransferase family protein [Planctomycetota bacterium]